MKLHSISVSHYRSITSAKRIRMDRTTVLIGPNNEGKSNILRALVLAMTILTRGRVVRRVGRTRSVVSYHVKGYDWEMDFPISKQQKTPNGKTEIILEFQLEESEYDEFKKEVKSKITGLLPLKITIGKNGVNITYNKKGKGSATLSKKSPKIAEFVSNRIEFEHIPAVRTAESAKEIVYELVSRELAELEDDNRYQEALNKIDELQKPLLNSLAENIQETLKQFLPNVKNVEITLPKDQRLRAFRYGIKINVNDGTLTPLNYKGDGVQSLAALAMIRYASDKRGKGKNFVIAIEEPESHLHPKAIHELKEVIDALGNKHQVILTSHNPLFVDRHILSSNIIVNNRRALPAKNVEEIRKVLGVRASDNLRHSEMVLVLEGEDDVNSIKAILRTESSYLKNCIDTGALSFDSLEGGTNLPYKLSLLRDAICQYHVFLDDDKCGRDSYIKAKKAGLLDDGHVNFAKAKGRSESELEDLINLEGYRSSIESEYLISLSHKKFRGKKKWSDRIKDVFEEHGKPWNKSIKNKVKNLVADQILLHPENIINSQDRTIIQALTHALEKRMKTQPPLSPFE